MLTGEYLVLCGAQSLALPLQYGQELKAEKTASQSLQWQSLDKFGKLWFKGRYLPDSAKWEYCSDQRTAQILGAMIDCCMQLNENFDPRGWQVQTQLQFDRLWGWGSSSTLIASLAQWAEVDPFQLSNQTLGGSGYDIACALSNAPILYQLEAGKPVIEKLDWRPPFYNNIFFAYTGRKRDSRKATEAFDRSKDYAVEIQAINELTKAILQCNNLPDFQLLLQTHERKIGEILGEAPVQRTRFSDFSGTIKSLGAWGGDFVMVASRENRKDLEKYFRAKGCSPLFAYQSIVYSP